MTITTTTDPNTNSSAAPVAEAPASGADAAPWNLIELRFFRDLVEEQRISFYRVFGVLPEGHETLNHGIERRLLRAIRRALATPPASEAVIASLKAGVERHIHDSNMMLGKWHEAERAIGSALNRAEAAEAQVATLTAERDQRLVDLEDAILACESGTFPNVIANYRSVRRTVQDLRASLASQQEG
jgi:hypothetical protein